MMMKIGIETRKKNSSKICSVTEIYISFLELKSHKKLKSTIAINNLDTTKQQIGDKLEAQLTY